MVKKTAPYLAGILALTFLARLPGYVEYLAWDEGMYAFIASAMLDGHVPYSEMPGSKEPGIFFLFMLIFKIFGESSVSVRLFGGLCVMAAAVMVYLFGREAYGRKGGLAASLMFGFFMAGEGTSGFRTNSEVFMTLPSVVSYYLAMLAVKRNKGGYLFWCGLAVGINSALKLTAFMDLAGIIAFLFLTALFYSDREARFHEAFKRTGALLVGFVCAILPFIGYLAYNNVLPEAWEQIIMWRFWHVEHSYALAGGAWSRFVSSYTPVFIEQAGLVAGAAVSSAVILLFDRSKENLLMVIWAALALFSITITGKFPVYYFPFAIPALAVLCGYGWERLNRLEAFSKKGMPAAVLALYMAVSAGLFIYANRAYYTSFVPKFMEYVSGKISYEELNRLLHPDVAAGYDSGRYVRDNSSPADRVFFWTNGGGFYWTAKRPLSTRQLLVALAGVGLEQENWLKEEITTEVLENPPKYFVVRDIMMLYAIPPFRAVDALNSFKELRAFLYENYGLEKIFGRAMVYRMLDGADDGESMKSVVFFPEFMNPSLGYPYEGNWFFYSNGSLTGEFELEAGRDVEFTVRAMGPSALGEPPAFNISIDGELLRTVKVKPDWDEYTFKAPVPAGRHVLKLDYFNDVWDPKTGEGRNLYVDRVVLRYGRR